MEVPPSVVSTVYLPLEFGLIQMFILLLYHTGVYVVPEVCTYFLRTK